MSNVIICLAIGLPLWLILGAALAMLFGHTVKRMRKSNREDWYHHD